MKDLIKVMSVSMLLAILPMILTKIGIDFKNKDVNTTGGDDAFGNVLIGMAPAVEAFNSSNENAKKKILAGVRDTIDNYLKNG